MSHMVEYEIWATLSSFHYVIIRLHASFFALYTVATSHTCSILVYRMSLKYHIIIDFKHSLVLRKSFRRVVDFAHSFKDFG